MSALDLRFHRDLHARLTEWRDAAAAEIVSGACEDFADYRKRCGEIAGVDRALREAEDVEHKMTGGDRPNG